MTVDISSLLSEKYAFSEKAPLEKKRLQDKLEIRVAEIRFTYVLRMRKEIWFLTYRAIINALAAVLFFPDQELRSRTGGPISIWIQIQ